MLASTGDQVRRTSKRIARRMQGSMGCQGSKVNRIRLGMQGSMGCQGSKVNRIRLGMQGSRGTRCGSRR